jgi:hypothetical protein
MAMTLLPCPTPLLLTVGVLLATAVPALATCPLSESVYRDVSGQGFELSWHDPLPDRASSKATLYIHRDGEPLYHLTLTQASGYGTISLAVLNADLTPVNTPAFTLNFFDADLDNANPLFFEADIPAPAYTFITGLGRYDYTQRRGDEPLLGETMWVRDRCEPDA